MTTNPDAQPRLRICKHCGCDCTQEPRVKDEKGQYYCRPCHDELAAQIFPAPSDAEYGLVAAAGSAAAGTLGIVEDPEDRSASSSLSEGSTNTRLHETGRNIESERAQERQWVWTIITPVFLMVVSLSVSAVLVTIFSGSEDAQNFFIEYVLNLGVGVGVFWLCTVIWIGIDSPFYLSVLRLAAIDAIAYVAYFVAAFYVHFFIGLIVMLVVYIGLLAEMLNLEYGDAIMFAVLRILLKILVMFPILAVIASFLNGA